MLLHKEILINGARASRAVRQGQGHKRFARGLGLLHALLRAAAHALTAVHTLVLLCLAGIGATKPPFFF
jgi:hypothetical protein